MKVHIRHQSSLPLLELSLVVVSVALILSGLGWVFYAKSQYKDRFYPEVYIDDVLVTGKTPAEAELLLQQIDAQMAKQETITLQANNIAVSSSAADLSLQKNYKKAIDQAFYIGHQPYLGDGVLRLLFNHPPKQTFATELSVNETQLASFIQLLKKKVDKEPVSPSVKLGVSGKANTITVDAGKDGMIIDEVAAQKGVMAALDTRQETVLLQTATISSQLSPDQVKDAFKRANTLVGKKVIFSVDRITETVNDQKIISLLKWPTGISDKGTSELVATWNKEINREPRNAVLEYDKDTLKVSKFVPPQNGLTVHQEDLKQLLSSTLAELETSSEAQKTVSIPVKETAPEIGLEKTNDLGINQQIGFGDSQYFHSIPGRIHNVDLTASRVNNTIVKAGAEFSFNKTLGEVSAATGFAPAYVIKNGRTELGDGGGVCQVSTTVFRAVLNAGLPVTKRIPHSYRVSYYELNSKPGIDATVYAGEVDLRFINDTGRDILIHTENNPKALYLAVEIYGTSDGRTTEIVDHKTWDAVSAPAPRYQDDPSLPKGTTKQVDFAAGGIKSSFTNVVKNKDGKELRRDTYFSNYKAWQAVFLVGTG